MARVVQKSNTRVYGFLGVVVLHILIIWALKAGLATSLVEMIKGPMETKMIEEEKIEKVAPPPPPPKYQALPPAAVIPLDIAVEAPTETGAATIDPNAAKKMAVAPAATVPPRSNPRRPVSQPEYPPTSKRLGEAGTVVMLLTVDESGKVTDAKIDKSSGFDRLDQAAMQEALHSWRLLPGTVGGKPTTMQYKFAVTFKITD